MIAGADGREPVSSTAPPKLLPVIQGTDVHGTGNVRSGRQDRAPAGNPSHLFGSLLLGVIFLSGCLGGHLRAGFLVCLQEVLIGRRPAVAAQLGLLGAHGCPLCPPQHWDGVQTPGASAGACLGCCALAEFELQEPIGLPAGINDPRKQSQPGKITRWNRCECVGAPSISAGGCFVKCCRWHGCLSPASMPPSWACREQWKLLSMARMFLEITCSERHGHASSCPAP